MKIKFNQKSQCKENRIRREIKELSEKQQTWDPERINARYTIINNNNSSLWSKQHLKSCKPTIAKKKKVFMHHGFSNSVHFVNYFVLHLYVHKRHSFKEVLLLDGKAQQMHSEGISSPANGKEEINN